MTADAVFALEVYRTGIEVGLGGAEQVLDFVMERARTEYFDSFIVKRSGISIEAVKAFLLGYGVLIDGHGYVFGQLTVLCYIGGTYVSMRILLALTRLVLFLLDDFFGACQSFRPLVAQVLCKGITICDDDTFLAHAVLFAIEAFLNYNLLVKLGVTFDTKIYFLKIEYVSFGIFRVNGTQIFVSIGDAPSSGVECHSLVCCR